MKRIVWLSLIVTIALSFCACSNNQVQEVKKVGEAIKSNTKTYETVLEEYTNKLQEATPKLIEEYKNEATKNTDGLQGLASLCNDKVSELAKISTDGIQEMAQLMLHSGSGSYDEYQEWSTKLQNVYMDEAAKIQDTYMSSAK